MDPTREPRVLVADYSRTGNTASVAEGLGRACEGDVEAILASVSRRGVLGYLFSGFEAMLQRDSSILPPQHDPHDYDIVLMFQAKHLGRNRVCRARPLATRG